MGVFDSVAPPAGAFDNVPPPAPYVPKTPNYPGLTGPMSGEGPYTPVQLQKAQSGVDVDTRLPSEVNFNPKIGFAPPDSMSRTNYLIGLLDKHFKKEGLPFDPGKDVRASPIDGGFEYKNPQTGLWTEGGYPFGALSGDVARAAGAVVGGIGGAAAMGGPETPWSSVGALGGATIGQGATDYIVRETGRAMGIDPSSEVDTLKGALGETGQALKWNLGAAAIGRVFGYAKWRLTKQGPISPDVANQLYANYQENRPFIDQFNLEHQASINPDIAQVTNDPVMLGLKGAIDKGTAHAAEIRPQEKANQLGLSEVWDSIVYPNQAPPTPAAQAASKEQIPAQIENAKAAVSDSITKPNPNALQLDDLQAKADALLVNGKRQDYLQTVDALRDQLQGRKQVYKDRALALDAQLKEMKGKDPYFMTVDSDLLSSWNKAVHESTPATEGGQALYTFQTKQFAKILPDFVPENGRVSLAQVDKAITDLGNLADKAVGPGGTTGLPYTSTEIIAQRTALKEFRQRQLQAVNPDLAKAQAERDATWNDYEKTWNRGFMADLIDQTGDGRYVLTSKEAIAKVLNRNDTSYDQFVKLVNESPQANNLAKQLFMGQYAAEATVNGIATPTGHQIFMDKYEKQLEGLFSPQDMDFLHKQGNMVDLVAKQTQALATMGRVFKEQFGMPLNSVTPGNIISRFFNKDPTKFSRVYGAAQAMDEQLGTNLVGGMKDAIRDELYNRARDAQGYIRPDKLAAWMSDNTGSNILRVFGPKMAKDVNDIGMMAQIINRQAPEIGSEAASQSIGTKFIKILTGVLTPEGRAVTALSAIKDARYSNFVRDMLYDPEKLHEFAQSVIRDQNVKVAARIATQLGFNLNQMPGTKDFSNPQAISSWLQR